MGKTLAELMRIHREAAEYLINSYQARLDALTQKHEILNADSQRIAILAPFIGRLKIALGKKEDKLLKAQKQLNESKAPSLNEIIEAQRNHTKRIIELGGSLRKFSKNDIETVRKIVKLGEKIFFLMHYSDPEMERAAVEYHIGLRVLGLLDWSSCELFLLSSRPIKDPDAKSKGQIHDVESQGLEAMPPSIEEQEASFGPFSRHGRDIPRSRK